MITFDINALTMSPARTAVEICITSLLSTTVIWDDFQYVITVSNHRVFVCKRRPDPVA